MRKSMQSTYAVISALIMLACMMGTATPVRCDNKVLGRVSFVAATKPERTAGVWIDGEYIGHVSELKGDKKILLMPGDHSVTLRQTGYDDWTTNVTVQPGQEISVPVHLEKNPRAKYPSVTAEVKLDVHPSRAAVFVDGQFVGYAHQFGGLGRAMLIGPGKHQIKVALVGYRDFTTELDVRPYEKFTLKTALVPGSVDQADPSVKKSL